MRVVSYHIAVYSKLLLDVLQFSFSYDDLYQIAFTKAIF